MISETLVVNQPARITFVMVDSSNAEVPGLGAAFVLSVSKAGGAFNPSAGAKAEIGSGWYYYDLTAAETNTIGPLSVKVTGAGCVQQNLEYVVEQRDPNAVSFTYTVVNSVTLAPIPGVLVWFCTDITGVIVVWTGTTDAFGVARDLVGNLPLLYPGTYYVWRQTPGFTFPNPDTEVVP